MSSDFPQFAFRYFAIQRRGRQRERQKKNKTKKNKTKQNKRFNKQDNSFERASHFFVHFFDAFARLRREKSNFALYGGRRQATTKFYFSFWAWISVTWNSASGGFDWLHSVWQSKWVGIIALKKERTQIHFFNDMTPCHVLWVISTNRSRSTRTPLNLLKGTELSNSTQGWLKFSTWMPKERREKETL